jgi:hypothetical protein
MLHQIVGLEGSELNTIQPHMKLLEVRIPSSPSTIGGWTFNSKADVALFVEKEMPRLSFSLFHDAITLLESITDGHTRKADVMVAMYQASHVGFDEDKATHIHSFKLIAQLLLGATKEGDKNDPKLPLPAVKDFLAWTPRIKKGGMKKRIQDRMDDFLLRLLLSPLQLGVNPFQGLPNWPLRCYTSLSFLSTSFAAGSIHFTWNW